MGKSVGLQALCSPVPLLAFCGCRSAFGGGGATRYARPCRPVKPLEMMDDIGMRSARHFVQRRFVVGVEVRKDGAGGELDGDVEDEVETVLVDCVELRRRRKGMLGRR